MRELTVLFLWLALKVLPEHVGDEADVQPKSTYALAGVPTTMVPPEIATEDLYKELKGQPPTVTIVEDWH